MREALANPIAHEPLHKLVRPSSKATIAFDDASGSYFQTKRTDFRQIAIEVIVEELRKAGVDLGNITLLLSQGLHRKLTRTEMETFLVESSSFSSDTTNSTAMMQRTRSSSFTSATPSASGTWKSIEPLSTPTSSYT